MRKIEHAPAYVLEIRNAWRVVVPVRGKLTPRIGAETFCTRAAAEAWLFSDTGVREVDGIRHGDSRRPTSAENSEAGVKNLPATPLDLPQGPQTRVAIS
jgi:hypothetical protein